MIAFVLRELGDDPSWIVGGVVPQLGGNAGAGRGLARRRGRRVGPLDRAPPARDRRPDERRARPPRDVRAPRRSSTASSTTGSRRCRRSCAARSSSRSTASSRVPGEHNRRNAAAALAALELAGVERGRRRGARSRGSPASTGASSSSASAGGIRVFDDYGHNPTEIAATLETARTITDGPPHRRLPAARLRADAAPRARARRLRSASRTRPS